MLEAIDDLPEDEREVFDLVRIQGLTQAEAAEVLGVSAKTVQRRLNRVAAAAGEGAGPTSARCVEEAARMTDDPRVEQLLDELLESGGTPEEVCRSCPELLPQVRAGWQRLRRLEHEVDALFPVDRAPRPASGPRTRRPPSCRGSPATRCRR